MFVVLLHGIGGAPGDHWQQWLADQLTARGNQVRLPALPDSGHPIRSHWLATVCEATRGVDARELVLVGHSLGATTALDYIEKATSAIHGFISIAGFAHDYGSELNGEFLRAHEIDLDLARNKITNSYVFYGDDDPYVTQLALHEVATGLNVKPVVIADGKHLNTEAGFTTFPRLLEVFDQLSPLS